MDNIIRVYDRNMKKLAYLENAHNIGYDLSLNELWYASFAMPADDPKVQFCQPFNYVEIYDGKERIELFRIMPSTLTRNTKGDIVYQCEHVLATLLDDVLFQYHQIGNIGVGTIQVLRYILDRQIDKRWQLGICEFDRRFEYKWENENLLAALFSVPRIFNEDYRWEFDTTGPIWRIHLRRLATKFKADITYKKNMTEIQKTVDPTTIVTRLYGLGYGEGDNQLDIRSVNNGIPYLESNGATTTWGIKQSIVVDRRYESPETLKAYMQSLLDQLKYPYKSYTTQAVDLYRKSPDKYEKFFPGDIVRIIDKEDNITEDLPIVKVSKSDITGNPGDITIEIANKSRDIAGSMSELQDRTRINEVYAQGATNQLIVPFSDNADANNPATMRVYIPDTMARINKLVLNYRLEPFRAFSKAIGGGGGSMESTSAGGASTETSSEGGSGYIDASEGSSVTSSTTDGVIQTTTKSGGGTVGTNINVEVMLSGTNQAGTYSALDGTEFQHRHAVGRHGHQINLPNHVHEIVIGGHSHLVVIPSHTHNIYIPNHQHNIKIPNHKHTVEVPEHIHDLEFGIYQGTTANNVTIKVDGRSVSNINENEDINIIDYLGTDNSGKINRNTWHEIEIIPNKMSRIVANVFMQIFTNSRGGVDK